MHTKHQEVDSCLASWKRPRCWFACCALQQPVVGLPWCMLGLSSGLKME